MPNMRRDSPIDAMACKVAQMSMAGRRQPNFMLSDSAEEEDQYVFTSLRYDPKAKPCKMNPDSCKEMKAVYLFKFHFDRLKNAAGHRGWYDAQKAPAFRKPIDLYTRVQTAVEKYEQASGSKGPYKVRILLRYHGNLDIKVSPDITSHKAPFLYPTSLDLYQNTHPATHRRDVFKVVLDALPTKSCLHTKDKTEWRHMYDHARLTSGIQSYQDAKEVLLFNCDGEIMDGSITTPYFFRDGKWITPPNDCGGQIGTTRRWAMENGLCTFGNINVDTLQHGETIWLSNAVKGFFTAKFIASASRCKAPSFRSTSISSSSTIVESPSVEHLPHKAML